MADPNSSHPFIGSIQGEKVAVAGYIGAVYMGNEAPHARPKDNLTHANVFPNERFVGRGQELDELHRLLSTSDVSVTQAVRGEGGIGKSELARHYALQHQTEYSGVWWLDASQEGFYGSVRGLIDYLGLPLLEKDSTEELCARLRAFWAEGGRHLVVLDNVETTTEFRLLRVGLPNRVLLTTRANLGLPEAAVLELDVLSREDARTLLRQHRSDLAATAQDAALDTLAEEVGRHAQSLALLAAYLGRFQICSPEELRRRLRAQPVGREGHPFGEVRSHMAHPEYKYSVEASLSLYWDAFQHPGAMPLLHLCSFCHPDSIPLELLASVADQDVHKVEQGMAELADVSVVRLKGERAIIHRITQSVVKGRLSDVGTRHCLEEWVSALMPIYSDPQDYQCFARMSEAEPHAQAVLEASEGHEVAGLGDLANGLGVYAWVTSRLQVALDRLVIAERIDRTTFGDDHPKVARDTRDKGYVLRGLVDFSGAMNCFDKAESINRAFYGNDHPSVATCLDGRGSVLINKGNLARAMECFKEAERIDRTAYGDDHPNVAVRVNNRGGVLHQQGDLAGAMACYEEAEKIDRAAYGDNHPNVAIRVNNKGLVLRTQGDWAGAIDCFREAERIDRMAYGNEHPEVATRVNNRGLILREQGDLTGAMNCFKEAERITRTIYGDNHPTLGTSVFNKGLVLQARGDIAGARTHFEQGYVTLLGAFGVKGNGVLSMALDLRSVGGYPVAVAKRVMGAEIAAEMEAEIARVPLRRPVMRTPKMNWFGR